jgi:hypothetical protein
MKTLWILAAAATFAACHNRSSDETGAAPDRGDSTMTTIDTTKTAPSPSTSGYDTTAAQPGVPNDTTMAPADTTGAGARVDTTAAPSGQTYDTTSTSVPSPSTDTSGAVPPSTGVDTTMSNPSAPTSTDTTTQR